MHACLHGARAAAQGRRARRRRDRARARFVFVRDGFHFWAFLLAPLWMLRHRMWLEFIAYLLLVGGVTFGLQRLGVGDGRRLGRASAGAAGRHRGVEPAALEAVAPRLSSVGVVVADDLEVAERRFFDGWVARRTARAGRHRLRLPRISAAPPSSDIVGLFPQPEARP